MKYVFLVLLSGFAISTQGSQNEKDTKELLQQVKTACVAETHVAEDLVEDVEKEIIADDETLHEYLFCVGKNIGFINDAGGYLKDIIRETLGAVLGEAIGDKVADECTSVDHGDGKANAVEMTRCYFKYAPKARK